MISTVVSIKLITQNRFIAQHFLSEERILMERIRQAGFPTKPIAEIGLVRGGKRLPPNSKYVSEGIPYVRSTDIRDLRVDFSQVVHISPEQQKVIARYPLEYHDVVISIAGTIGAVGVMDEQRDVCQFNENMARITRLKGVNPHYLGIYLDSSFGQAYIKFLVGGAVQPKLSLESINKILVPLPPRPIQDRIAQVMQDAYAARRAKLAEAEAQLKECNSYIFDVLGMSPEYVSEATRFLKSASELRGNRFDVAFNMGFHKLDPYSQAIQPVKAVATFPKESKDPTRKPDQVFKYVDIASVDIVTGVVGNTQDIQGVDAPSRARQVVHVGDIIVSTVRPTRGAIALITPDLDGFVCSTGFCIVRANDSIHPEYLHAALRLGTTLEQFDRRSAGSSYPAILERDIQETLIPVPDEYTQERIAVEVSTRRTGAEELRSQAEALIIEAKARVERMILGEEGVP